MALKRALRYRAAMWGVGVELNPSSAPTQVVMRDGIKQDLQGCEQLRT
jgi:hypothetical protein